MKVRFILPALLLTACAGFTKQDFLQDGQNATKSAELAAKRNKSADCDKLGALYNFTRIKSPTKNNLADIMPVFGLTANDAADIDKLAKLNYSVIDKLNCTDNTQQLLDERKNYCDNKYPDYTKYRDSCRDYLQELIFEKGKDYSGVDKNNLKEKIKEKIRMIYPLPSVDSYIVKWFDYYELIKADNTVIGEFETEDNNVTRLRGIELLFNHCQWEIGYYSTMSPDELLNTCACFAHNVYKNADFKNILYIYEKDAFLPSKKTEYLKEIDKCKTIIKKQTKQMEIERYGEVVSSEESGDAFEQFFIETLENAAWAHKTATDMRKKAEQQSNKSTNK